MCVCVSQYYCIIDALEIEYMLCMVQESAQNDPNSHSYMQSSVMSYSNTGDGAPKVYQATSASRQAPGGVRQMTYFVLWLHISVVLVGYLCKALSTESR